MEEGDRGVTGSFQHRDLEGEEYPSPYYFKAEEIAGKIVKKAKPDPVGFPCCSYENK